MDYPITIKVTERSGAYTTNTVGYARASCTHSAELAAQRLAEKLAAQQQLPAGALVAVQLPAKGLRAGVSVWQIRAENPAIAAVAAAIAALAPKPAEPAQPVRRRAPACVARAA